MSSFLDEVFAEQQARQHRPRRSGEGLSGSGKRFATLLTLLVGLTAVPTFIMVRAGVQELRSLPAAPVRPTLLEVPDKPPPSNKQPLVAEPEQAWSLPVLPSEPVVPQRVPLLERTAVVDTSVRPVAEKPKKPKKPSKPKELPAQTLAPEPSKQDSPARKPKQRKHKHHHVDRPKVERPDRPERPEVVKPHRERVERPRS